MYSKQDTNNIQGGLWLALGFVGGRLHRAPPAVSIPSIAIRMYLLEGEASYTLLVRPAARGGGKALVMGQVARRHR